MKGKTSNFFKRLAACVLFFSASQVIASEDSKIIELEAPASSNSGSFVIHINVDEEALVRAKSRKIQLWRSHNGGEFQLITAHSSFSAISQNLDQEGTYAYQARVVANAHAAPLDVSETSYVKVSLRYPELTSTNFGR